MAFKDNQPQTLEGPFDKAISGAALAILIAVSGNVPQAHAAEKKPPIAAGKAKESNQVAPGDWKQYVGGEYKFSADQEEVLDRQYVFLKQVMEPYWKTEGIAPTGFVKKGSTGSGLYVDIQKIGDDGVLMGARIVGDKTESANRLLFPPMKMGSKGLEYDPNGNIADFVTLDASPTVYVFGSGHDSEGRNTIVRKSTIVVGHQEVLTVNNGGAIAWSMQDADTQILEKTPLSQVLKNLETDKLPNNLGPVVVTTEDGSRMNLFNQELGEKIVYGLVFDALAQQRAPVKEADRAARHAKIVKLMKQDSKTPEEALEVQKAIQALDNPAQQKAFNVLTGLAKTSEIALRLPVHESFESTGSSYVIGQDSVVRWDPEKGMEIRILHDLPEEQTTIHEVIQYGDKRMDRKFSWKIENGVLVFSMSRQERDFKFNDMNSNTKLREQNKQAPYPYANDDDSWEAYSASVADQTFGASFQAGLYSLSRSSEVLKGNPKHWVSDKEETIDAGFVPSDQTGFMGSDRGGGIGFYKTTGVPAFSLISSD